MNKPIWTSALLGTPHTKKNSQRILAGRYGGRYIAPSKKYTCPFCGERMADNP